MVYPKQMASPPGAVDKDKVLALHDYEGTCGLCLEPCDSTQDELNALCCTFEPCPSPSIYHQSCLEAYLKSIRLDKQRKTGFACPRNCGKAAKGEKACPGRVSKSHPIYARNDNSKKRRKAKMPEPLVIPPAAVGKKPPLPKASPKEEKASASVEERGRVVALVKSERASKPMPILVVNSARQQVTAAHEEARAEIQVLRARRDSGRVLPEEKAAQQKKETAEPEEEYAPPRGPTSLADFTVAFTKMKGRKGATASAPSTDAKKGATDQVAEDDAPQDTPMEASDSVPAPPSTPPAAVPDPPPTPPPVESPRKTASESPRQEEVAAKMRSPSKSQRKHQQRLAARHSREKHDIGIRATERPAAAVPLTAGQPGAEQGSSSRGGAGLPSPALAHPLETVQETAAFPPLPSTKPSGPLRPLPALRLVPPARKEEAVAAAEKEQPPVPLSKEVAPSVGPQAQSVEAWSGACEAALRERKVQVHATQLQGLGYFSEAQCVAAVRACGADLNRCCEWLLLGGTSDPPTTAHLDISAELSRLTDLLATGAMTQAALESAVLRHKGDIDAALLSPSASVVALPAPPISIVTTPALPPSSVPSSAVSPGGGSEFGAISRPSSSSSNRSAGSPWGGLDSRGSSSEASSFFSTSAWGSLSGTSLVPSPPSVNGTDSSTAFSPFAGGFPSELLRTSSWRADAHTPRTTPPWPGPQGGGASEAANGEGLSSRQGSLVTRGADPFHSFGVRSASSVEAWSLSDLSDPDSADSAISEATQSTVTSVAAAVLQDSFDDPVPPPPPMPPPTYAHMYTQHPQPLWAGPYQEGPPAMPRMGQAGTQGQGFVGMKHGHPGVRNGVQLKTHGATDPAPALWGFAGMPPPPSHAGFGDPGFYEGPGRGMAAGYARHSAPNGPFVEGPQYAANGRQPRGVLWRDGRAYGPEGGPHHWADQDRLVTQLLSQLLV